MQSCGACLLCLVIVAFLMIVLGYITDGLADRNGELLAWYALETCYNAEASSDLPRPAQLMCTQCVLLTRRATCYPGRRALHSSATGTAN